MQSKITKRSKKRERRKTRTGITHRSIVDESGESKIKEPDIFDIVSSRKRDIENRENVVQQREEKEKREIERCKDPIYKETCKSTLVECQRKYTRRARVLKERLSTIKKATFNSMQCPSCKKTCTDSRSWIISKDKTKVICRSCFYSHGFPIRKKLPQGLITIKLFEKEIRRYPLNSVSLCRMRQSLSLTVKQFADLVGWSSSYQYALESCKWDTISEKTMSEICQVFSKKGLPIKLDIWGDAIIYYEIEGSLIRSVRRMLYLSMIEFADKAGWDIQFQHRIETNKLKKISKQNAEIIQEIITS